MNPIASHPTRNQNRASAAFTLIELLTVIAIIGILAGILIPTVGSVRKTAQTAACVSNLRQIGVAFQLHAEANKGNLPMPQEDGVTWPMNTWMYKLQPYLEDRKIKDTPTNLALCYDGVFRCPGKPNRDLSKSDAYKISYGMNTFDATWTGEASRKIARPVNILLQPSITMLAMDRATFTADGADASMPVYIVNAHKVYRDAIGLWHKGKDNVLFVDGHVEALPKNGLSAYLIKTTDTTARPW